MQNDQLSKAVTDELLQTICELQSFPAFSTFALAGGTNLALRYNHRRSVDIDLFSNSVVGTIGLAVAQRELENFYGNKLIFCEILDPGQGNQYCFLKALVTKENIIIKIEAIQNIQILDPVESLHQIRLLSKRDIALLKLMSASNRMAKKDIYDLDLLSDEIPLGDLIEMLRAKQAKFNNDQSRCLFDLDEEKSPVDDIRLLLAFDHTYCEIPDRHNHSNDNIDILPLSKSWISARASWRRKVKALMRAGGITPPGPSPIN